MFGYGHARSHVNEAFEDLATKSAENPFSSLGTFVGKGVI
jgi:hypothetical protein